MGKVAARAADRSVSLIAVALLRDAGGGSASGVGALALLPVFWLALHGTRRQLVVILTAMFAFFLAPVLLTGGGLPSSGGGRVSCSPRSPRSSA